MYFDPPLKASISPIAAAQQLDVIEADLNKGRKWSDKEVQYKLHQLAGSSLQAGARELGRTIKVIEECREQDQAMDPAETMRMLRSLLQRSRAEVVGLGLLPAEPPS